MELGLAKHTRAIVVRPGEVQGGSLQRHECVAKRREAVPMALGIYFVHEGFTPEKYDNAIKKLEDYRDKNRQS